MNAQPQSPITLLLHAAGRGDEQAAAQLLPLLYDELRQMAALHMAREAPGHTLQPTALVHEAWLRLAGGADRGWDGRAHFFAAAAEAMRRILVEQARRKKANKRPPSGARVPLEDVELPIEPSGTPAVDVLDLDAALRKLEERDPRKAQMVNVRYFAGLTLAETAAVMGVSVGTVEREWRFTRALLRRELGAAAQERPARDRD